MSTLAAAPLRRRTLERQGMTPEQELELLVREQQADDTYFIDRKEGEISLNAPTPDGRVSMGDLIGVGEEGETLVFFRPHSDTRFDDQKTQHGTIYGYRRLRCRCVPCTVAQSKAVREYRARKKAESAVSPQVTPSTLKGHA